MKHLALSALGLSSCSLIVTLLKPPFPENFNCGNGRTTPGELCFDVLNTESVGDFRGVTLGDQDGDGALDILAGNNLNSISITHLRSDGTFSDSLATANGPTDLAAGDFSGDGIDDVTFTGSSQAQILRTIAVDTFSLADSTSIIGQPFAILAGSFDGEQGDDIVIASAQADAVSFFNTINDGEFSAGTDLIVGDRPVALAKGDFDGDADLDFVVANQDSQDFSSFVNNGATPSSLGETFIGGTIRDIALGDFNGDSLGDVATVDGAFVRVVFQNGAGFDAPISLQAGTFPNAIAAGDFDGDGLSDFAVVNLQDADRDVTIFLGDASGALTPISFSTGQDQALDIAAGDINSDGVDDLAVTHGDGTLIVLLSNP